MYVYRNTETCSCNHCFITYSECVFVAFIIQLAQRMHRIILSPVACPAVQYFSTVSHKRHDYREKSLNIKYVY
jgi:hypothetical protein